MNHRLVALTVAAVGVVGFGFGKEQVTPAGASPAPVQQVPAGVTRIPADQTRAVQLVLSSFGYTIAVDGEYGPQTTKVVRSWQRANGLEEDGIAGPITQGSLGLSSAQRGSSQQVTPVDPPSIPHYDTWVDLAQCESGGNWSTNTGNGYYGGLQFALSTWRAVGGQGYPHQASAAEQMARAETVLNDQGWKAWPACSRELGLR